MKPHLRLASFLLAVVAVAAALACPGCGGKGEGASVRVATLPMVASLPVYVAEQQHYFEEEGVKVSVVPFANSNDMVTALIAKELDVLPAVSTIPIFHLETQHPGTVRLFSHSRMTPGNAMDSVIVAKDSALKDVAGLAGRKVGVFPGTSARRLLSLFLKQRGIDDSGITYVALPPPTQVSSLSSGAVDALFSYEPITTIATAEQGCRTLFGSVYCALIDPCPVGASAISRAFERDHPDLAAKAVRAIDKAVLWIRANPTEAKKLLERVAKVPPGIADKVTLVDVTLSTEVDKASLQAFAALLRKVEELPADLDVAQLVAPTGPR